MAQIMRPKGSNSSGMLGMVGTVAGGLFGGGAGAAAGGQIGGMAAGAAGSVPQGPGEIGGPSAIKRKMESMSPVDVSSGLEQGVAALQSPDVPPEVKEQVAKPILSAAAMDRAMRAKMGGYA